MLPTLQDLLGPADAQKELGRVARLVGLQFHEETARDMDLPTDIERGDQQSAWDYARWLSAILRAEGEDIETTERDGAVMVIQTGWRAMREGRAHRSAGRLRCLERAVAGRRRGARPLPAGSDHPGRSATRAGRSPGVSRRGSRLAGHAPATLSPSSANGSQRVSRCSWLSTTSLPPASRQAKGRMRTKRPGRTSNRCPSSPRADLDREARLLPHLANQRHAMILARIGPPRPADPIRLARSGAAARGRRGSGRP